jgi:hypothetical protein
VTVDEEDHGWLLRFDRTGEDEVTRRITTPPDTRISRGAPDAPLAVRPLLADRDVVARLATPLRIPAESEATFFVSTPLWAAFWVGDTVAMEVPTVRLSDTWWGPLPERSSRSI